MSALDARIRHLAQEEARSLFLKGEQTQQWRDQQVALTEVAPDRVTALEKEVADLRARLEKLEGASSTPTAKRTPRKTAEPSE